MREVAVGFGALAVFVVLVQLLYPSNRALPFSSLGDTTLGYKTTAEVGSVLQDSFEASTAHIAAEQVGVDAKLTSLGAELDAEKTAAQITQYPLWQRVLSFSIFWARPQVEQFYVTFNSTQLSNAASSLSKKLTVEAKNGAISIGDGGEVALSEAKNGVIVTDDGVKAAITKATYLPGTTTVTVTPKEITQPAVTNETVNAVKSKITTALQRKITLQNGISKETYTPDKKTVGSWIKIGDKLSLTLDKDAVAAYANAAAKAQLVAAGTTKVTVVDGVEKSRTTGATGRGVNVDALVGELTKTLFGDGATAVTVNFVAVAPTVVYDRSYSSSQAALQAYINDVTAGGNIEISVKQLSGAGWSASSGASKSVVAASTYKLFISLLLFDRVAAGQIDWSDSIQGTNVETCLYNTIIYSANNCAEQWIGDWGRTAINSALYGKGFSSSTTFTASDATHTSAQDLLKLLVGLHNQSLFNTSDAGRLIGLMKNQVYRKGIPAGSSGVVADKVGFLWDYLNDAAIVYHSRGTYALVVMTKGQSWGKIAEITRQIEKIMYP